MKRKSDFTRIMHYVGWRGNSDFIKDGSRPYCAQCSSKKLEPIVELVQQGFDGDKVWLVMRCKKCTNTTIFDYELQPLSDNDIEKELKESAGVDQ